MKRPTFTSQVYSHRVRPEERWLELLCVLGLLLAALILYTINLGSLPLRDWDEATVAQVAKEIYQSSPQQLKWLFPTLWGEPYLNKPPLIHSLIALAYSVLGINEFSSRIIGASLTACSIPLLYCLARELFLPRYYALLTALVYLTTLPVIRHGRLAMLDGAVLCFQIFMMWCLLRSRRDLRWALGAGLGFGLICLSKGWMLGLLLGTLAFVFIIWDTPRLITSIHLWFGIMLGTFPLIMWQTLQWLNYGNHFINTAIFAQSLDRIYEPVEGNSGPIWYYLIELLKYPHPWLFLAIFGLKSAWQHRNWGWGKLILIWSTIYLVIISAMMTKLPWYILPIYPALALAGGVTLAEVKSLPDNRHYPRSWLGFFIILSLAILGGIFYFLMNNNGSNELIVILGLICLTMLITSVMILNRDEQFIIVLFWGMYVSLLLFFSSDYWLWELNEAYPVKPVADLIKFNVPANQKIYTSFGYERPSLNFYSEHKVMPLSQFVGQEEGKKWQNLKEFWQEKEHNYLLVNKAENPEIMKELNLTKIVCQDFSYNADSTLPKYNNYNKNSQNTCLTNQKHSDWLLIAK